LLLLITRTALECVGLIQMQHYVENIYQLQLLIYSKKILYTVDLEFWRSCVKLVLVTVRQSDSWWQFDLPTGENTSNALKWMECWDFIYEDLMTCCLGKWLNILFHVSYKLTIQLLRGIKVFNCFCAAFLRWVNEVYCSPIKLLWVVLLKLVTIQELCLWAKDLK